MQIRIKSAAGAIMFISAIPATAQQEAANLKSTTPATNCASCPPPCSCLVVPGGPVTWLVVPGGPVTWFSIGTVFGLVVGLVLAKALFGRKVL